MTTNWKHDEHWDDPVGRPAEKETNVHGEHQGESYPISLQRPPSRLSAHRSSHTADLCTRYDRCEENRHDGGKETQSQDESEVAHVGVWRMPVGWTSERSILTQQDCSTCFLLAFATTLQSMTVSARVLSLPWEWSSPPEWYCKAKPIYSKGNLTWNSGSGVNL